MRNEPGLETHDAGGLPQSARMHAYGHSGEPLDYSQLQAASQYIASCKPIYNDCLVTIVPSH